MVACLEAARAQSRSRSLCGQAQADRSLRLGCAVSRSNGMSKMTTGVRTDADATHYKDDIARQLAARSCEQNVRQGTGRSWTTGAWHRNAQIDVFIACYPPKYAIACLPKTSSPEALA